jgi:hypothetical protein
LQWMGHCGFAVDEAAMFVNRLQQHTGTLMQYTTC